MEPEKIKQILEASFSPFRCVAELYDFDERIRFRVFDKNNKAIITISEKIINEKFSDTSLKSIIKSTKNEIKKKGYDII